MDSERQLTFGPGGRMLANANVFSPDSKWIVCDRRAVDSVFDSPAIDIVNVATGEIRTIFEARNGARVGVATFHPHDDAVIFIHGPEFPDDNWSYGPSRRQGAIVETERPGAAGVFDARDLSPPFSPGALRGGSHVHVLSPSGARVSFTYNDAIVFSEQRNIGVGFPRAVVVPKTHPRNHDGSYFCVVVTRTVAEPEPGSDEICRAFEEGWAGENTLVFLGETRDRNGAPLVELFAVDLPPDLSVAGDAPLEGTETSLPAPPNGTIQRRLTFTRDRKFPGVMMSPRHWVRCSPDGKTAYFLLRDNNGYPQLFKIAVTGGETRPVSSLPAPGVTTAFCVSPDGEFLAAGSGNTVLRIDAKTGAHAPLPGSDSPFPLLPHACVVSPDGETVAFLRAAPDTTGVREPQLFVANVRTELRAWRT